MMIGVVHLPGRRTAVAGVLLFMVASCTDGRRPTSAPGTGAKDTAPAAGDRAERDARRPVVDPDRLIRADGIAHAAAGMTIGDLRAGLPSGVTLGRARPYMVDIAAMPVVADGDTLYLILIPSGEPSHDDARINLVAITDTTFRTMEGIGPGSTLADATRAYGAPTLSYSTYDESREYATFPDLHRDIRLRVLPPSDTAAFAGIYETSGEYNETRQYDPSARIGMVIVYTR
ncbi:MAG TPA: hypothetical protein VHG09_09190 [Longimicrobiales bacterium]|nr:hypothetical protein [Longimicrobiales bacterium]